METTEKTPVKSQDGKRPVKRSTGKRPPNTNDTMRRKKKKKKKKGYGCLIFIIIIVAILAVAGYFGYKYGLSSNLSTGDEYAEISVTIPEGATVEEIADILEENNVIDSRYHFLAQVKLNNAGSDYKSGSYLFNNNMSFYDISDMLSEGAVDESSIRLLIKEGQWLSEIAESVEELGICTADEFIEAANSKDYEYDFVQAIPERSNQLEGYLYPNTYFLREDMTARDIVDMLLKEFERQIEKNNIAEKLEAKNMTLDDAVKIASLIEAEVKYEPERALVSSVIHNRLADGDKLQIDASVIYALGERRTRVYYKDLTIEDGHNTYYVEGLPVGPINSPRIESIIAACEPEETNYKFYVVENSETGQHIFCETYEEFEKARDSYLAQVD